MSTRRRAAAIAIASSIAIATLAGCSAQPEDARGDGTSTEGVLSGTLTVFAAASLTESFDALARDFEQQHPSVDVVVNYAGSSALAQQIVSGAPADVFAAASEAAMRTVTDEGLAADPVVFATNTLELVVPAGNPAAVTGVADLGRRELAIALCDPVVPCGAATQELLTTLGVTPTPDTLEEDVKAVVTKVLLGEADAGLVYVTDVQAAGDAIEGIEVDGASAVVNRYAVAALAGSPRGDLAAAWIALLTGPEGRAALRKAGFGAP